MLDHASASCARASDKYPALRGKRILVVEDDAVIAVDYHFQLEGIGANHSFEASNRQALEYLASHHVDAAIVDFHLRDGCCIPTLRDLTARHIPFIVISGDTFAMREIAIDAPVLSKPVPPCDVCQALCDALP